MMQCSADIGPFDLPPAESANLQTFCSVDSGGFQSLEFLQLSLGFYVS